VRRIKANDKGSGGYYGSNPLLKSSFNSRLIGNDYLPHDTTKFKMGIAEKSMFAIPDSLPNSQNSGMSLLNFFAILYLLLFFLF
jgi:hypothetical protein